MKKKVAVCFLVLVLAVLVNLIPKDDKPTKVAYAGAIVGYALRVDGTGELPSHPEFIAALNAELPIVTVSYNQYDSAQSSRPGERIMGLPRSQALPQ